jgi:hypothetical protein
MHIRLQNQVHQRPRFGYVGIRAADHVSDYSILALHRSLTHSGVQRFRPPSALETMIGKALSRVGLRRNLWRRTSRILIVALMGEQEYRLFPYGCYGECVFYCYDCWPNRYGWWEQLFVRYRTRTAFFSARQAAVEFARRCPWMSSLWLPEATDPTEYAPGVMLKDRNIHVLELGRRHELVHQQLEPYLRHKQYVHLYEPVKGQLVFPTQDALKRGLSDSMISVCFPCSMTHTERSGNAETATHRFFESMASKCLVVGHCPKELEDIFGYNPVVEVSAPNCVEEVQNIIEHIDEFQDLVDRNYSVLLDRGTWGARVANMLDILDRAYT